MKNLVEKISNIVLIDETLVSNIKDLPGSDGTCIAFKVRADGDCLVHALRESAVLMSTLSEPIPTVEELRQELVDDLRECSISHRKHRLNEHAVRMRESALQDLRQRQRREPTCDQR